MAFCLVLACIVGQQVFQWFRRYQCEVTYRAEQELKNLSLAADDYRDNRGEYPVSLNVLISMAAYRNFQKIRCDPWGVPYQYKRLDIGFEIRSGGPDKRFGTVDDLVVHGDNSRESDGSTSLLKSDRNEWTSGVTNALTR
jgi:hypothetical protein